MQLRKILTIGCLATSLYALPVAADWTLQNDQSSVHFISTKNQHISEIHHFAELQGSLKANGDFKLSIDLASVKTNIDIRDKRMRDKLFMVDSFPKATISASLPDKVMKLKDGESVQTELAADLTLMGKQTPLTLSVQIHKTADGHYIASSIKPILLSAASAGLQDGVGVLQKLAGLSSISLTVPVTFNLLLKSE